MFYSTFAGIELGQRALDAEQLAMQTTSQNIANASTPGYSRQSAQMVETYPFTVIGPNRPDFAGQLGTGVEVETIQSSRDSLLNDQIRKETSTQSNINQQVTYLGQVEDVIQEPSNNSIGNALDNFWSSWQNLSANPSDTAARNTLISQSQELVETMQSTDQNLASIQSNADQEFRTQVGQINELGSKIADLNAQISQAVAAGQQPNDLTDQRDQDLAQLSQITNCQVQTLGNGMESVTISGHTLVQDDNFNSLNVANDPTNNNFAMATWSDDGTTATFSDGQMKGLMEIRDNYIPNYRASLNTIAQGVMTAVNPLQSAGYGYNSATPSGQSFFTGTDLQNMAVNPVLVSDPSQVAAAGSASAPGDGSNALAIADLQNSLTMSGGTQTIGETYQTLVSQIGQDSQTQTQNQTNQNLVVSGLTTQQQSVSGVNMDEEMSNLIKYQDAYQAATRIITTVDECLNTLINDMGLNLS